MKIDQATTADLLLGGRIQFLQPEQGYRVAIDPVILAAAVTARSTDRILDAGCGAGAASLCLAARSPECAIFGVERDPASAALARGNVALNALDQRIAIIDMSFGDYAKAESGRFDQVMTNPPFYPQGLHTMSPHAGKAASHGEGALDLKSWIDAAALALRPTGKLTLIHRADRLGDILAAFGNRFGAAVVFPLWPRAGSEAKRILVTAIKGRRTQPRLLAGLTLHRIDGQFTEEANAILRDARHLDLAGPSA